MGKNRLTQISEPTFENGNGKFDSVERYLTACVHSKVNFLHAIEIFEAFLCLTQEIKQLKAEVKQLKDENENLKK
ncbi:MAG: hypothetical protein LC664_12920 [Flavobacteriales bacterium]|nr:hypothetical protein [Flavobacteriales bacterium]